MNIINVGDPKTITLTSGQSISATTTGNLLVECVSGLGLTAGSTIATLHGSANYGPYATDGVIRLTATVRDGAYEVSQTPQKTASGNIAAETVDLYDPTGRWLGVINKAGNEQVVASYRVVTLPARAQALIPGVPVVISNGRAQLGCDPVTLVPMDPRAGATQYYVDIVNGVDTNNGSTWALAFKSIYKATQAGNTAAVPYTVNIAAGVYPRGNGFSNNGAGVTPTQSCVFKGIGGQVICHTGNALTWALDSGTTYSTARSNCKRVLDWINFDAEGDYSELPLVASLAICRATPGSWYTDGTTLYVNRADGAVVSDANTLALLTTITGIIGTNSGNMHLFNITQLGGTTGCLQIQNNQTGKTYAENCKFNFSTGATYIDNVVSLDQALVVMNKCVAAKSQKDGFNYHNGGAVAPKAVHIDCIAYGNGVVTSSNSNNGATIHDAGVMLDLNGRYFKNYGGDYAHANASTIAVGVCTQTYGSYGDLDRPSGITRPGSGFVALSGSTIYKYDCSGVDQVDGGGSIIYA